MEPQIDFMKRHIDFMDPIIVSPYRFHASPEIFAEDYMDPLIDYMDPLIDYMGFLPRLHGSLHRFPS